MMKTLLVLVLAFSLIVSPAYAWGDREQGALIGFAAGMLANQIHQDQHQLPDISRAIIHTPIFTLHHHQYIMVMYRFNHYILIRLFLTQSVNVTDRLLFNLVGDEGELKLF